MDKTEMLLKVATYVFLYKDELNLDENKISSTLGKVFRIYKDEIKNLNEQEIALLVCFLSLKEENEYKKYINIFTKEVLASIIKNSKNSKESFELMKEKGE